MLAYICRLMFSWLFSQINIFADVNLSLTAAVSVVAEVNVTFIISSVISIIEPIPQNKTCQINSMPQQKCALSMVNFGLLKAHRQFSMPVGLQIYTIFCDLHLIHS